VRNIFSGILGIILLVGFLIGGFKFPSQRRRLLFGLAVAVGVPFGIFIDFILGSGQGPNCAAVGVPIWFFIAIGIGVFGRFIFRQSRHQPVDPNAKPCAVCGYDLRASRDKCPECGTVLTDQKPSE
jgi:hypothetical protein